ncbi:hypothetical protein [Fibrella aquatica]|jgi:hypothetical protein|uniref:hypothetical protein n=1 Tax=Fibrella aquatica TaxID=3242487 RepID=UPI0035215F1D
MKYLLLLSTLCLLIGCKTDDPQARLLVGRWELVEYRSSYDNVVHKANATPDYVSQIEFKPDGSISQNNVIWGPYCSQANRYVYKQSRLYFNYGPINCVTFIAEPPPPEFATVEDLSANSLTMKFGSFTFSLKRI